MKITTIIIIFLIAILHYVNNGGPFIEQDMESRVQQMEHQIQDLEEKYETLMNIAMIIQLLVPIAINCQYFLGGGLLFDLVLVIMLLSWRNKTIKTLNPKSNGGKGVRQWKV